jgi:integrase
MEYSVYKLCCKDKKIKDLYVGITKNFNDRKALHKQECNDEKNKLNVYKVIRENGGFDKWDMIEIEKIECKDKKEAITKEKEYIEKLRPTLNTIEKKVRKITADNYTKVYLSLISTEGNKAKSTDLDIILEYIKNNVEKINTRRTYLSSVIGYYRINNKEDEKLKKYSEELVKINKILRDYPPKTITKNQETALKVLTIDNVKDFIKKLEKEKSKNIKNYEEYLMLAILCETRLRNDLIDLEIITKKDQIGDNNCILITNKEVKILIQDHKTSNKYGTIENELSKELSKDIRQFVKFTKFFPRKYLFQKKDGTPLDSAGMANMLIKLFQEEFKINATSTTIRKLFSSKLTGEIKEEIIEEARKQAHSIDMAVKTYSHKIEAD